MFYLTCIVLAAGKGTRMKSDLPKLLHPVAGRPLVYYPLKLVSELEAKQSILVVPKNHEALKPLVGEAGLKRMSFAVQDPPKGTAHAVMTAMKKIGSPKGDILILNGDLSLMTPPTLIHFIDEHQKKGSILSFMSALLDDPRDYGRVIRNTAGEPVKIVEALDTKDQTQSVREINAGVYLVKASFLADRLSRVKNINKKREFYLPDLVGIASEQGLSVHALRLGSVTLSDPTEALGVNTQAELALANKILFKRNLEALMGQGVRVLNPETVFVDTGVKVGRGTTLMGPCYLMGQTQVGKNCFIEPGVWLKDSRVKEGVTLKAYTYIQESVIREGASVGPLSHLRPGTVVGSKVRIGNFVEIKESKIKEGSKVNHLTYLGDARIGKNVNVGAGTITCNYDGFAKHPTLIGDQVFIGSDSQLVAPVQIGKGAYIGSGSTITKNVSPFSLALTRAQQVEIKGWAKKRGRAS